MKITIHNLGVVQQAEIDLRPLTVFIGKNNTGKTWVSYTLAAVLGKYGLEQYAQAYVEDRVTTRYPPVDETIEQFMRLGIANIDLAQFAQEYGETFLNGVARLAPTWMAQYMGAERADFSDLHIQIDFDQTQQFLVDRVKNISMHADIGVSPSREQSLIRVRKEKDDPWLHFYSFAEDPEAIAALKGLPEIFIKSLVPQSIFGAIQRSLFIHVHAFITERPTFALLRFPAKDTEDVQVTPVQIDAAPRRSSRYVRLSKVTEEFADTIQTLYGSSTLAREKRIQENPVIQKYIHLAELLERDILGGGVDFSTPEPDPRRELLFQPAPGVSLEFSLTSSMVKELAPLALYLRYQAQPGELLIIDEPEMNLHPEAQARMIEFLAMLVDAGLHVLMTTHSPYIVDHLSNLMRAARNEDREEVRKKFYLQRSEALIAQEDVSVYLFENGTTRDAVDEQGFVDWETFGRVSEDVSRLLFD